MNNSEERGQYKYTVGRWPERSRMRDNMLVRLPFEDAEISGRLSMASPASTISPHASPMCLPVSCVSCKKNR